MATVDDIKANEPLSEETDRKEDPLNVDVSKPENVMSTEDMSENKHDNEMEQNLGMKSGNQLNETSSESQEEDSAVIENNMAENIEEDTSAERMLHEEEMEQLRNSLQDEYQKQVLRISDELRDHYQNDMDEKITKLEEDWEQEFAKQKHEFDEQVSAVQREQWTQCQEAIERVTLDAEDQLKNMKYVYERETAEHKQRIKELLEREALWEMKEKELANEKSEKERKNLNKIKKLENQLSFEREEVESQLNGAQDEMQTLKQQHQSEIASLTAELEKKYSDIVDEMRKELKSKYQDEMDRKVNQVESHLREQYEQDLEKTKEEVQETTSTLKTKYEKQVAETLAQLEEQHERNQEHEVRETKLKESFESEKRKVAELMKEMERKTKEIENLREQKQNDLKTYNELEDLEEKLKQSLNEKCVLEEKVKEISESEGKELIELRKELARKNEIIHELEQRKEDSEREAKKSAEEKDSLERGVNESYESEKLDLEAMRKELEKKDEEIQKFQEAEEKNCKEHKELEDTVREISKEKQSLEQALEQNTQSQKKQIENLQQELERKRKEVEELSEINDIKKMEEYGKLEFKLHEITIEKQSLQQQLEDSNSQVNSLKEKLREDENVVNDLKSKYDTKILQITRTYEAEVDTLENELKMNKSSEEEASTLKKDVSSLNDEVSRLNDELQKHKATILELEETSRGRELEIANMILNSPSPQSLTDKEFDFSENSIEKTRQLENELVKYKNKVKELEEEAEDKFETTLCPNCGDREKSEEILLQTKALVDKIQLDCQKKVQSMTKDLEKTEKALHEQVKESEVLKEKLAKTEEDLHEEQKRSLEISKLGGNVDVNANMLGYGGTLQDIPGTSVTEGSTSGSNLMDVNGLGVVMRANDDQMQALTSLQSQMRNEDDGSLLEDNKADSDDFKSLFNEQEKFYKREIASKDAEISNLMIDNEKIQHEVQSLEEKLDKGEIQYEQLRLHTLEQKTKYECEINLMQSEIKMVIEENNEGKDQLEIFQNNKQETELLQEKLRETENELNEKSKKYEEEILALNKIIQEKESCISDLRNAMQLLENSRKGVELNLSNQKQTFLEREKGLLDEIREMTVTFENEKTKILKESFQEKEEMKNKINNLEMSHLGNNLYAHKEHKIGREKPRDIRGNGGVDLDSLLKEHNGDSTREIYGYEEVALDNLPKDTKCHEVVDKGSKNTARETENGKVQYEEIHYYPADLEHQTTREVTSMEENGRKHVVTNDMRERMRILEDDMKNWDDENLRDSSFYNGTSGITDGYIGTLRDKKSIGYDIDYSDDNERFLEIETEPKRRFERDGKHKERLSAPWKDKHEILEEYAGFDDTEYNSLFEESSPDKNSLFSDDKYKEIGCDDEENFDLLSYEHDIDLLLERKENERLRAELETLTKCVDVFHNECESLKRSLDKTVNMMQILQEERDGLMKEHDLNMAEHSELMLDLVKYEETISRLQKGNEKLDDERKLLQECLWQKQATMENTSTAKAKQLGSKVDEIPRKDSEFLRTGNECQRKNYYEQTYDRKVASRVNETYSRTQSQEEMFGTGRPHTQDFAQMTPNSAEAGNNEEETFYNRKSRSRVNADTFSRSRDEMFDTEALLRETLHTPANMTAFASRKPDGHFKSLQATSSTLLKTNSTQSFVRNEEKNKPLKHMKKTKLNKMSVDENNGMSSQLSDEDSSKLTSKHGLFAFEQRGKVSFSPHGKLRNVRKTTPLSSFPKRKSGNFYTEHEKSTSRNFSPRISQKKLRTPILNASKSSSKFSNSSILTSTRANVTTTERLFPNLSGLSPIVSPLDRHYHAEKMKWKMVGEQRSSNSRKSHNHEDTTYLVNADPYLQTPQTERSSNIFKRHPRSRSADDRLLTSSREVSLTDDLDTPLVINFEDYVFRHRVKSSEDVANLRDPSPAELWFS